MAELGRDTLAEDVSCPFCGYDLRGLKVETRACPECGRACRAAATEEECARAAGSLVVAVVGSLFGEVVAFVPALAFLAMAPNYDVPRVLTCMALAAPGGIIAWWFIRRFRQRCGCAPGWLGALIRTQLAYATAGFVLMVAPPMALASLEHIRRWSPARWEGAIELALCVAAGLILYRLVVGRRGSDLLTRFLHGGLERFARIAAAELAAQRNGDAT